MPVGLNGASGVARRTTALPASTPETYGFHSGALWIAAAAPVAATLLLLARLAV